MIKVEVMLKDGTWLNIEYTHWKFPVGEIGVKLQNIPEVELKESDRIRYTWIFENNEELFILLNLKDAVENYASNFPDSILYIPYLPYSRQDRVCHKGESTGLWVMGRMLLDSFEVIATDDVHNEEAAKAMIPGIRNKPQHELSANLKGYDWFIAPDAGAAKKIMLHPEVVAGNTQVYIMTKSRVNGKVIHDPLPEGVTISGRVCVVDDLCDAGNTFLSVSQLVNEKFAPLDKFDLYVTHGFFTQGVDKLRIRYDTIYTYRTYNQEAKPFVKEFCNEV